MQICQQHSFLGCQQCCKQQGHVLQKSCTLFRNIYQPNGGVAVGRDPHASEVVCIDLVFDELATALLVHVNAPRLAMVDLAAHHRRVGICLNLKTCYAVPVDVAAFKIALWGETESHILKERCRMQIAMQIIHTTTVYKYYLYMVPLLIQQEQVCLDKILGEL